MTWVTVFMVEDSTLPSAFLVDSSTPDEYEDLTKHHPDTNCWRKSWPNEESSKSLAKVPYASWEIVSQSGLQFIPKTMNWELFWLESSSAYRKNTYIRRPFRFKVNKHNITKSKSSFVLAFLVDFFMDNFFSSVVPLLLMCCRMQNRQIKNSLCISSNNIYS